jgi:hypothetical protein
VRVLRCVWVWGGHPCERGGLACGTPYRQGGGMRVFVQHDECTQNSEPVALSHNDKYPSIAQSPCHLRVCSALLRSSSTITIAATVVILRRQGCRCTAVYWRHWQVCALFTVVQGTQVAQVAVVHRPLLLTQASFLKSSLGHADCHDANVDIYGHNS